MQMNLHRFPSSRSTSLNMVAGKVIVVFHPMTIYKSTNIHGDSRQVKTRPQKSSTITYLEGQFWMLLQCWGSQLKQLLDHLYPSYSFVITMTQCSSSFLLFTKSKFLSVYNKNRKQNTTIASFKLYNSTIDLLQDLLWSSTQLYVFIFSQLCFSVTHFLFISNLVLKVFYFIVYLKSMFVCGRRIGSQIPVYLMVKSILWRVWESTLDGLNHD